MRESSIPYTQAKEGTSGEGPIWYSAGFERLAHDDFRSDWMQVLDSHEEAYLLKSGCTCAPNVIQKKIREKISHTETEGTRDVGA